MALTRIIIHWTAGTYNVSDMDRDHYHFIVDGEGHVMAGRHTPEANASTSDGDYAAHTMRCNTGSIGISMACMGGAIEAPFNAGKWPMKEVQVKALAAKVAALATKYKIPVTEKTVLTHAEVQPVLGIKQRGKWDVTRIAFRPALIGHKACGDYLREMVKAAM